LINYGPIELAAALEDQVLEIGQKGIIHAGRVFAKASLRRLLTNAVYAGKVEHRGALYGSTPEHVDRMF
jgi:hypothetical protein